MKVHFIMKITATLVMAYLSLASGNQVETEQRNEQRSACGTIAGVRKAAAGTAIVVSGGEIVSEGAVIQAGTAASAGWLGTAMGVATAVGPAGWAMIGVESVLTGGAALLEMGETGALLGAYNDQIGAYNDQIKS